MKKGLNRGEKGEDGSDGVSRGFSNEKKVDDGFSRNFPPAKECYRVKMFRKR